ncbi:HAMP domain-containing sensor histidine kinase [Aliikangiella sp. IMCC44359]|uniref:HAMP domain-containing sensor histidine kinase n=1 Tax=Aliikangiella sp. IMCC44359 TaxID=3459125 RepID=UPI00403A8081
MSFRKLSLIFITSLLSVVLLLQWWSITSFTKNVAKQVGESAFEVSRSTAETLIFDQPRIEFHSIVVSSTSSSFPVSLNNNHPRIRQDVVIELNNEQEDDFILLNASGSDYQIPIPRTGIHMALENFSNQVLYSTILLLFIGVSLAVYFTSKIASPLKKLQSASISLGEGKLGVQIKKDNQWHSNEIDSTIDSFNLMSQKIKQLQKQNEVLQNKAHLAELAEIARGLAHTIRNPLNTLNLALDQIESSQHTYERSKLNKLAKQQVNRIDKWIRSLIEVMNNDTDLIKPANIRLLLISVIDDLKLSSNQGINIVFNHNESNIEILAIKSELKSILQSIIGNALEASPAEGCIQVFLSQEQQGVEVKIIDQGPGFSDNILEHLFSPHNTDKTYGAGMGLYLAHRIISHKYHGSISVKNNSNRGSSVTLIINHRGK